MFNGCTKLKEIKGINKFITANVTDMNSMFNGCKELEYLDLSNFNIYQVVNMDNIFDGCIKIKRLNIFNFTINSENDDM